MPTTLRDEALKLLDGRGAILDAAREISAALREAGVEGAIVGGVAVVLHGYVRTTVDVDVYSPEPAERVIDVLESLGFTLDRARREFVRDILVVHIVRPEQVAPAPRRLVEIDGVTTVSLADLIAMKLRSGLAKMTRAKDLADVIGLIGQCGLKSGFSSRLPEDLRPEFRKLVRAIRDEGP
ncbi:MAG TPA: DUF6036 family nucleotidyltransferase [Isosphaeraceae bacterium]